MRRDVTYIRYDLAQHSAFGVSAYNTRTCIVYYTLTVHLLRGVYPFTYGDEMRDDDHNLFPFLQRHGQAELERGKEPLVQAAEERERGEEGTGAK